MSRQKENQADPLTEGKGRTDEVDQSKGFFPPGVPHPPAAEIRTPGSIGRGPYEESGRGGLDVSIGPSTSGTAPRATGPATGPVSGEAPQGERAEEKAPQGALPPHEQRKK